MPSVGPQAGTTSPGLMVMPTQPQAQAPLTPSALANVPDLKRRASTPTPTTSPSKVARVDDSPTSAPTLDSLTDSLTDDELKLLASYPQGLHDQALRKEQEDANLARVDAEIEAAFEHRRALQEARRAKKAADYKAWKEKETEAIAKAKEAVAAGTADAEALALVERDESRKSKQAASNKARSEAGKAAKEAVATGTADASAIALAEKFDRKRARDIAFNKAAGAKEKEAFAKAKEAVAAGTADAETFALLEKEKTKKATHAADQRAYMARKRAKEAVAAGTADTEAVALSDEADEGPERTSHRSALENGRRDNESEVAAEAMVAAANGGTETAALVAEPDDEAARKRLHKNALKRASRDRQKKELNEAREKLPWAREILKARAEGKSCEKDVEEALEIVATVEAGDERKAKHAKQVRKGREAKRKGRG